MRLDHLLSKEKSKGCIAVDLPRQIKKLHSEDEQQGTSAHEVRRRNLRTKLEKTSLSTQISGGDALRGHTRSHPEHDG